LTVAQRQSATRHVTDNILILMVPLIDKKALFGLHWPQLAKITLSPVMGHDVIAVRWQKRRGMSRDVAKGSPPSPFHFLAPQSPHVRLLGSFHCLPITEPSS